MRFRPTTRGLSSLLVRLVALLLVPWVIVASGSTAEAAYKVGQTATAQWQAQNDFGGNVDCSITGYFVNNSGDVYVKGTLKCSTGFNIKSAHVTVTAKGETCSLTKDFGEQDGVESTSGTLTNGIPGPVNPAGCVVTEACYEIDYQTHGGVWLNYEMSGCVPWALGSPPETTGSVPDSCRWGKPQVPVVHPKNTDMNHWHGGSTYFDRDVTVTVEGRRPPEVPGPLGTKQWYAYVVVEKTDGTGRNTIKTGEWGAKSFPGESIGSHTGHVQLNKTNATGPLLEVIGVGVLFADPVEPNAGYDTNSTSSYVGTGTGILGKNKPEACVFYWGKKLGTTPNDDYDEPMPLPIDGAGGVSDDPDPVYETPAPPDSDPGCGEFSLFDASTWASGGICVLVKAVMWLGELLGAVLRSILGVLNGIVQAILDGLMALFVPTDGAMEAQVDALTDSLDSTPYSQWESSFDSAFTAGGSAPSVGGVAFTGGCQGPAVTWDKLGDAGLDSTIHPLDACGGVMADAAYWSRLLLTVAVGLAGGLKMIGMLANALGLNRGVAPVGHGQVQA